jgi:chorismate mutase
MGWTNVAIMCGHEMDVPGGQERCIRVLILVNTDKSPQDLEMVYLREAANLRSRSGRTG